MKSNTRRITLIGAAISSLAALVLGGASMATDGAGDDSQHKFDSRQRLERTVLLQDRAESVELREALEEAEALLERAENAGAEQEVIDRIKAEVDRRQAAYDEGRRQLAAETERVRELIAELSDEQVFAYNRSLNNAISNDLVGVLDDDTLKRSLGADLDRHQINFLTLALEKEANFQSKADALRELAEETGDDSYLEEAARAEAKAESMREKFLAKVRDRRGSERVASREVRSEMKRDARDEAKAEVRGDARRQARQLAKALARETARQEARSAAQREAKKAATTEARESARSAAREESRGRANAPGQRKKDR